MTRKFGWIPDLPDIRDFKWQDINTAFTPTIVPNEIELNRDFMSPIEDQGSIGSCTAHAGMSIVEYMQRKAFGRHIDGSRLFLYKTTRNLMGVTGDTGAYLRDTIKALRMIGVPPEANYPYRTSDYDKEPTAFTYALASNYKAINYFRVDSYGFSQTDILASCKDKLTRGYPLMFGFTCFESLYSPQADAGDIPFPSTQEAVIGGHAVAMIGFNNTKKAFRIRNSWGPSWGENGYGWLPYNYLLEGLLDDIWGVTRQDWVDTGVFS